MGVSEWMFGRTAQQTSRLLNNQGMRAFVLQTGKRGLESRGAG